MKTVGLDIGGANIKYATDSGAANSVAFPLWRTPEELTGCLENLCRSLLPANALAVTMTGELCDAFASKSEGVHFILESLLRAVRAVAPTPPPVHVWTTEGHWLPPEEALADPLAVAAANWLAVAMYAARYSENEPALLVDVGSTTTDIIPLDRGVPIPHGRDDTSRLLSGELIYTGVSRTPIGMLVDELPHQDTSCPIAREVFATTLDAYLLLEKIAEDPNNTATADGRSATRELARARMARMLCVDPSNYKDEDAHAGAQAVHRAQMRLLTKAFDQVCSYLPDPPSTTIVSGSGEFLAHVLAAGQSRIVSLTDELGPKRSETACAFALAKLLQEKNSSESRK